MFRFLREFALAGLFALLPLAHAAIDPDEFESENQRVRYQQFIADLRCPKCQNQNLAGSDAPIAADLRKELRRLLKEGQTDQQILDFMVSRYGEFVTYKPPFDKHTAILWLLPALLLSAGVAAIGTILWRHRRSAKRVVDTAGALSETEQAQLDQLLLDKSVQKESADKSAAPTRGGKHA